MPVGALGAGVGSAMATGMGAGRGATLGAGRGGGGGAGGGGVTLGGDGGAGGAMNSLSNCAGTITSAALRNRPDCSAQMPATCSATTEPTITALRRAPPGGAKRSDWDIKMIAASAFRTGARGQKDLSYLRKIHQAEPATRIRLPASVDRSSMPCFPKWSWQAGSVAAQPRCAGRRPGAMHCTARSRRGRSFRSTRTGWPRPVRTGFRRSPCRRVHGGQSHGPKFGGKHRRSWRQAVWLAVERMDKL